ncbi:MAG TPA: nucleotide exchange factor GrpE [Candidatus Dojkabacteria bacterium]|nr:nucleotide exchange factor GrpE [Candidatus Dojkabacteria bacterium]
MSNKKNENKNKNLSEDKLEKKIQELALTIDKVEDEKLEVENQLKRALADYHNLLKHSEKRDKLRLQQIKKNLFDTIVPTLDALMLAAIASKEIEMDEKGESWLEGILAIIEGMKKGLKEMGFEQYIPEKGEDFDRDIHEAIATVQEGEKGKIYDTIQPGYILDGSVVRPARVVVSK